MSLTLERDVDTLGTTSRDAKTRLRIIDCDIHPYLRTPRDLDPFLVGALAPASGGIRQGDPRHLRRARHLSALHAEHVPA